MFGLEKRSIDGWSRIALFLKCLSQDAGEFLGETRIHHTETKEGIGGSYIEGDRHVSAAECQIETEPLYLVLQLLMSYPPR